MHLVVPYCSYRNWEREKERNRERGRDRKESQIVVQKERGRDSEKGRVSRTWVGCLWREIFKLLLVTKENAIFGNKIEDYVSLALLHVLKLDICLG